MNSEHCRHKVFGAEWKIDGKLQDKSLFGMIETPLRPTVTMYYLHIKIMLLLWKVQMQVVSSQILITSGAYHEEDMPILNEGRNP